MLGWQKPWAPRAPLSHKPLSRCEGFLQFRHRPVLLTRTVTHILTCVGAGAPALAGRRRRPPPTEVQHPHPRR